MRKLGYLGILGLLAVLVAGCAGSGSSDSSSRKAAIGSSTPAAGEGSISSASVLSGAAVKVESWKLGMQNNASFGSTGLNAGKTSLQDFQITKNIDNASTTLASLLTTAKVIQTVTFKVGTALTYTFTNAIVTDIEQTGDGAAGDEAVTFSYQKICMVNAAAGSSPTTCWNLATNSPS